MSKGVVYWLFALCGLITGCTANNLDQPENCHSYQDDPSKIVCACNSTHCDRLEFQWPTEIGQIVQIQTSRDGRRFHVTQLCSGSKEENCIDRTDTGYEYPRTSVHVDLRAKHQEILGWGGGITDAFGVNAMSLSNGSREQLLASYFGDNGLQYSMCRVPMGGTDFSPRPYTYDDLDPSNSSLPAKDYNLTHWSLAPEDYLYKIPLMRRALELTSNRTLRFITSPWSAPAWMKDNNNLVRGHLIADGRTYQSYADYWVKFLDSYRKEGIQFWGATMQNEVVSANWPKLYFIIMQFSPTESIEFISKFLGPTLERAGYTRDNFKLLLGDDQLGLINYYVPIVMTDQSVHKYVSGIAYHWYISGTFIPYDTILPLVSKYRDQLAVILMTEAAAGNHLEPHLDPGNWNRAEMYAADIIEDLKRFSNGWIDWNMALNMSAGPNYAGNACDSAILVDASKDVFYKQPIFYALGHFSRFFRPGSRRVEIDLSEDYMVGSDVLGAAVYNEHTQHMVVNLLNTSPTRRVVDLYVDPAKSYLNSKVTSFTIEPRSINTIVVKTS